MKKENKNNLWMAGCIVNALFYSVILSFSILIGWIEGVVISIYGIGFGIFGYLLIRDRVLGWW